MRSQFPDWPGGYTGVAMIQRELRWFGEAEATLAAAVERFPAEPEPYIDYARVAEARGDWPEAALRWELVRESFPDRAAGYVGGAGALRELGRADEAEALTAEAAERFSTDATAAAEYAGTEPVARATLDSDAASPLAPAEPPETIAEPASGATEAPRPASEVASAGRSLAEYLDAATELRSARRLDEANALLAEAMAHFPDDPDLLSEAARVAEWRGDWPEAARYWEAVHNLLPGHAPAHISRARALIHDGRHDAAETLLEDAAQRFPENFELLLVRAECAAQRRDWPEAALRWEEFRDSFPDRSEGYLGAAQACRELGRPEEAEALVAAACERFPDDVGAHNEYAWLATFRRDWHAALQRWEQVRDRFPEHAGGYTGVAMILRESRRFQEAEAGLIEAIERFPGDPGPRADHARVAEVQADFPKAARRWLEFKERFPEMTLGYIEGARALERAGSRTGADALITEAESRFPSDPNVLSLGAEIAFHRGDHASAIRYGTELRDRFPRNPAGWFHTARALRDSGRTAETEELLADAPDRFPEDRPILSIWVSLPRALSDNDEAVRRSRWFLEHAPNEAGAHTHLARALLAAGAAEEAKSVLENGRRQFPNDAGLEDGYGELLMHQHDWVEAVEHWRNVRQHRADHLGAYMGEIRALRESGRPAEAEALTQEAAQRFPDDPAPALEAGMAAHIRRDLATAIACWEDLRKRFPRQLAGYTMGSLDLFNLNRDDEAEEVVRAGMERLPNAIEPVVEYARLAERRQRWPAAVERWDLVRSRFPDCIDAYTGGAAALTAEGRHQEADGLLEAVRARFPEAARIACEYAWNAYRQHRWDDAEQRFGTVRQRFPGEPAGYHGGAAVLINYGRLEEAERMLEEGIARIPSDPFLRLEHARIPASPLRREDRDWDLAISRLEELCSRFADFEHGYIDLVRFLRERGRLDEAEAVAARGLEQRTRSAELAVEYAKVAQETGDLREALRRYDAATQRFPDQAAGFVGQAEVLSQLGKFDEAEAVLERSKKSFPTDHRAWAEYARLATRAGRTRESLHRWNQAVQRFPNNPALAQESFVARLQMAELEPSTGAAGSPPEIRAAVATAADGDLPPTRELVCAFESLGGTLLGCEFGLFQRACGAEPLGLLRWTDMELEALIAALEAEFAGVGLPDNTELLTPADESGEYATRDRRYGMRMHTFVSKREVQPEKMFAQVCRRLQFLREKLLEDLRSGEKIFVYKITARNLAQDELHRLLGAVRSYAENTLFYVRYSDAEHPPGMVEMTKPGLLIGYIEHFAMSPSEENLGAQTVAWTELCQRAYRLWRVITYLTQ